MTSAKAIYEGSVKRVYQAATDPGRLWFEFTDDYSVFDWGKMPDTIANKGRALAVMGAHFFAELGKKELWQRLAAAPALKSLDPSWLAKRFEHALFADMQKEGLRHHFCGLVDGQGKPIAFADAGKCERLLMEVEKAQVTRPVPTVVWGQSIYDYQLGVQPAAADTGTHLVPLEVVFRFGMPAGSSLKERIERDPDYARSLGFDEPPVPETWFARPVLEFFTKLERKDRLLSVQEALTISRLSPAEFSDLCEVACDAALALYVLFAEAGIELWDGKFEFLVQGNGNDRDSRQILLADSIGPDELRLIYQGVHLSKEMLRQYYRGGAWEQALKQAQKLAAQRGQPDWKAICQGELRSKPEVLPAHLKGAVDHLYGALVNHLTGQAVFAGQPDMETFVTSLTRVDEVKRR